MLETELTLEHINHLRQLRSLALDRSSIMLYEGTLLHNAPALFDAAEYALKAKKFFRDKQEAVCECAERPCEECENECYIKEMIEAAKPYGLLETEGS